MPKTATPPTADFLQDFVLKVLKENGFDKLSQADQAAYLPQFMAEAERRLGLKLTAYLNTEAAVGEFNALLTKETAPDAWFKFWNAKVPNFNQVVKDTLEEFGKEVKAAIAM